MNLLYIDKNGNQAGPVTDADFVQMLQTGEVSQQTYVWREGMPEWLPWEQDRATRAPFAAKAGVSPSSAPGGGAGEGESPERMTVGGLHIDPNEKDAFVQRTLEGVDATEDHYAFATFWERVGAYLIDWLILSTALFAVILVGFLILGGFGAAFSETSPEDPMLTLVFLGFIAVLAIATLGIPTAYYTYFHGCAKQATPGKQALKLRVVTDHGEDVTYLRAFGRYMAAWFVSGGITSGIGYIIAAFDEEKRTLHDHICATRVMKIVA